MNAEKVLARARKIKSNLIRTFDPKRLFSVRDVCRMLNVSVPDGVIDPDKKLSMICCFEGVFIPDCLYVHYEREPRAQAERAFRQGAALVLASDEIEGIPCIVVPDVFAALRTILTNIWEPMKIPTAVVTGSIGKTTTKNLVNHVFAEKYRTFCNMTNGNTFEYIGFELQRFDRRAERFVQEVNESDPDNAKNASLVLKPDIAMITNMDKSHIGELGSEENIIRAIMDITAGMDENGVVIINGDDKNSVNAEFRHRVIRVAVENEAAECIARNIEDTPLGLSFDICYEGKTTHIVFDIPGKHNVYNIMMAFVAGRLNDIPEKLIARGVRKYRPLGFRQNMYRAGRRTLYADCYNASERSIRSALGVIDSLSVKNGGRRIAVIGDIAEIDGYEEEIYRGVAEAVSGSKTDVLLTYGKDTAMIAKDVTSGIPCFHAGTADELTELIKLHSTGPDVLLFKASRSMALEQIIRRLFPLAYVKGMMPIYRQYLKWTLKTL